MSFDKIFDLTAGVYFNFYNIYCIYIFSHLACVLRLSFLEHQINTGLTCMYVCIYVLPPPSLFFCLLELNLQEFTASDRRAVVESLLQRDDVVAQLFDTFFPAASPGEKLQPGRQ